jgi:hypothetical protein
MVDKIISLIYSSIGYRSFAHFVLPNRITLAANSVTLFVTHVTQGSQSSFAFGASSKAWLVHGQEDYGRDFLKYWISVICPLGLPNRIALAADSVTLFVTHCHARFTTIFCLWRTIKGMAGTRPSRFWLACSQEFDIGHLPTCFVEFASL